MSPTESAKQYRKGWRKKKITEQRSERRKAKQTISESIHERFLNVQELDFHFILRKRMEKWESMNLREWIRYKADKRIVFTARNFFKTSYNKEEHESSFSNFLENLFADNIDNPKEIAALLKSSIVGDLSPKGKNSFERFFLRQRHIWLSKYFEDNQVMRERLKNWIEKIVGSG
ncbi:hypothetical protein [Leptospira licerasiae]|nr:hypothetical protein [Leptospira licerasiae]